MYPNRIQQSSTCFYSFFFFIINSPRIVFFELIWNQRAQTAAEQLWYYLIRLVFWHPPPCLHKQIHCLLFNLFPPVISRISDQIFIREKELQPCKYLIDQHSVNSEVCLVQFICAVEQWLTILAYYSTLMRSLQVDGADYILTTFFENLNMPLLHKM